MLEVGIFNLFLLLITESNYWSSWSEWKYSELKHECVSRRTCMKVDHDVTVDALCLGDDRASVRYEVKTAPYCDEAINIEVEKVMKGIFHKV